MSQLITAPCIQLVFRTESSSVEDTYCVFPLAVYVNSAGSLHHYSSLVYEKKFGPLLVSKHHDLPALSFSWRVTHRCLLSVINFHECNATG